MDLPLHDLHSLLYGFDQFFGRRPTSVHPHDSPTFRIHQIPFDLGTAIRNADPDESFFHVEFIPPDRAELWHSVAWRDSLTRRLRIAGVVGTYQQTPRESTRGDIERKLILHFKNTLHIAFKHARALTEMLLDGPENPHVYDLAILPPEIVHAIKSYRNTPQSPPPSDGCGESTVS